MFGMVTGYRLQLRLRGIISFAPRVTGYKVTRGVAGINELIISASFGQSQKDILESMHRLHKEVMPFFKNIDLVK